jgi:hypothetical protein
LVRYSTYKKRPSIGTGKCVEEMEYWQLPFNLRWFPFVSRCFDTARMSRDRLRSARATRSNQLPWQHRYSDTRSGGFRGRRCTSAKTPTLQTHCKFFLLPSSGSSGAGATTCSSGASSVVRSCLALEGVCVKHNHRPRRGYEVRCRRCRARFYRKTAWRIAELVAGLPRRQQGRRPHSTSSPREMVCTRCVLPSARLGVCGHAAGSSGCCALAYLSPRLTCCCR